MFLYIICTAAQKKGILAPVVGNFFLKTSLPALLTP